MGRCVALSVFSLSLVIVDDSTTSNMLQLLAELKQIERAIEREEIASLIFELFSSIKYAVSDFKSHSCCEH